MQGTVVVDVKLSPKRITLGELQKGEKATSSLGIDVTDDETTKITGVTIADERFELVRKTGEVDGDSTYEVRFKGEKQLGRIRSEVVVTTVGEEPGAHSVPVSVNVVANLRYTPRVRFSKRKGEYRSRNLDFSLRSGDEVEIKKVRDPDGLLKWTLEEPHAKRARIRLEVDEAKITEETLGKKHILHVKTSEREQPNVEIEYTIFDSPPARGGPRRAGFKANEDSSSSSEPRPPKGSEAPNPQ